MAVDRSKINVQTWLIILIIVVILVIYVASLGHAGNSPVKVPNELSESRERAKYRHRKLEAHIKKQKQLQKKLERKFKRVYFGVRVGLFGLWIGAMVGFAFAGFIENLGDLLNFSNASLLLILGLDFLTFGSVKNVNDFVSTLKERVENWVYEKYVDIDERIEANEGEMQKLEVTLKQPEPTLQAAHMSIVNIKPTPHVISVSKGSNHS